MAYRLVDVLHAGPLTARLEGADLVDVRLAGTQVVTRIGVRVRDTAWRTIAGELAAPAVRVVDGGFVAELDSCHRAPGIDVAWRGRITGTAEGELSFAMDGEACGDTTYNRIGLVVLHAVPATAGRRYRSSGAGAERRGRLPRLIAPQPMEGETVLPLVPGFTELDLDLDDGATLRFAFEGDVFEIEDQRNWSDGSFKTYSTPVGDPVPRHLPAGAPLRQRVRLSVAGTAPGPPSRAARDPVVVVEVGGPVGVVVPPIGLGFDHDGHEPTAAELSVLRALAPAHLRVDVAPRTAPALLAAAGRTAAALGAELEVAVSLDADEPSAGLELLVDALMATQVAVARVIVLRAGARVASADDVACVRTALADRWPLLAGTDRHFAELNRERPAMDGVDGLAYPLTPQAHDTDERSLVESLAASADTVATARSFAAGTGVHVTPVTLKPRWNAFEAEGVQRASGELPAAVDPRQPTGFAAAWTVGSIRRLAESGPAALTYFELTGWRGVAEREDGSPLPGRFPSRPRAPFPVLGVLADATRWRGADLLEVRIDEPLAVEAFAVATPGGPRVLLANLRPEPTPVRVSGARVAAGDEILAPWSVRLWGRTG